MSVSRSQLAKLNPEARANLGVLKYKQAPREGEAVPRMEFELPWPPSVNHYWCHTKTNTYIGKKGKEYRRAVCTLLMGGPPPILGRVGVSIVAFMPDRRRRDLDNLLKAIQDSLGHAGVYKDDSQIDDLHIVRGHVIPGGKLHVSITVLEKPLSMEKTNE